MADIVLKCGDCGHQLSVSEYVASATVSCPMCHGQVKVPGAQDAGPGLQIRPRDPPPSRVVADEPSSEAASVLRNVHKIREKEERPRAALGWFFFLALSAGLIGFQYLVRENTALLTGYLWTRNLLGIASYISIIVLGYGESLLYGFLCLLFPPYTLYYALIRTEFYLLRGAFAGFVVALCAEVFLLPDASLLDSAQSGFNRFIETVEQLIQRAGDAPTF